MENVRGVVGIKGKLHLESAAKPPSTMSDLSTNIRTDSTVYKDTYTVTFTPYLREWQIRSVIELQK